MDGTIYYNYGANYAGLDDIQRGIQGGQECRDGVIGALNALSGSGAFVGQAADRHHTVQIQSSQQMDNILADMQGTHRGAIDSQVNNAQLDNHLAGGF